MDNKKKIKKTVLVIGGTGFLGHHISKKLIKLNYKVISVSLNKPKKLRRVKKVKYLLIDIRNKKELFKFNSIKNIDYIINFSGYIDHIGNKSKLKTHFYGTKNLISFFEKKKIKLFIQAGSSLEYGKSKSPHKEQKKSTPISLYAKAKFLTNLYLQKASRKFKFDYLILRIYQVYGPGQNADRLIPQVIKSCLRNEKFNCSEGSQKRDYLFIEDFLELIIKILKSKKITSGIYNVGSSKPVKIKNIIKFIKKNIKKGIPVFGGSKMRSEEMQSYFPDISKIKKYFKWSAKIRLKQGLIQTIKYYKKNE